MKDIYHLVLVMEYSKNVKTIPQSILYKVYFRIHRNQSYNQFYTIEFNIISAILRVTSYKLVLVGTTINILKLALK